MVDSTTICNQSKAPSEAFKRERIGKVRKLLVVVLITLAGTAAAQMTDTVLSRFDPGDISVAGTATKGSPARSTVTLDPGDLDFVPAATVTSEATLEQGLVKTVAVTAGSGYSAPLTASTKIRSRLSAY